MRARYPYIDDSNEAYLLEDNEETCYPEKIKNSAVKQGKQIINIALLFHHFYKMEHFIGFFTLVVFIIGRIMCGPKIFAPKEGINKTP